MGKFSIDLELSEIVVDADDVFNNIAQTLEDVAEAVGALTIAYLRSLTNEMRPPIGAQRRMGLLGLGRGQQGPREAIEYMSRGKGGPRPAHPGHWADVTGQLALSYSYEVRRTFGGIELVLKNNAEYAMALEAHDGYFVLTGVTEPGGPAEQALRRAVAEIAPGWEFR
jgi:hypothetical protein